MSDFKAKNAQSSISTQALLHDADHVGGGELTALPETP